MKYLYPVSHQIPRLSDAALTLKIARHSGCSVCYHDPGLRPPPGVEVVPDDVQEESSLGDLTQYGSDDDDPPAYLDLCVCGHSAREHGADQLELGRDEFARRGRVAVRLDELLQDVGRLLDFDYVDDDINSLRMQMKLPVASVSPVVESLPTPKHSSTNRSLSPASSILSDLPPPSKKRRVSMSSLSAAEDDDEDEDDEEEQPLALAALMAPKPSTDRLEIGIRPATGQGSGKKLSSMKSKGQTAPISLPPSTGQENADTHGQVNGVNGHDTKVKVEDKMDEGQLSRLATGVTVDTAGSGTHAPTVKSEKAAVVELRKGVIQITAVENDGQPRSWVILTGLKTLFQKQLPKMPREYIARLVYDSNSKALAIIKRGYKVVGGICYRPFPHRGFAEIVFFATASVDQVKGYGGMLMDHFKMHIRRTYPRMLHFLTYADNYAVGYFRKQGFSKDITLDRSVWAGYIKDYEGGTIMQCTMVEKVNYLEKAGIIARQREAILSKIREMSKSHIVYDGLPQFRDGANENVTIDSSQVPGLKESGWTPTMVTKIARAASKGAEHNHMQHLLSELQGHPQAWAFLQPVNGEEVADYYDVIRTPMDFSTIEHKLETNQYPSLDAFVEDAQLVFDNCRTYNPEGSIYAKNATRLEKYMKDYLNEHVKREE